MAYVTVRERGTGGFGVVYEVRDDAGQLFALKTLKPEAEAENPGADLGARFRREVKYQSAIDHPNVVKIIEHHLGDTPPWFIMELALCSLSDELEVDQALGGEAKRALFDILSGLQAIHAKGYKHRDLKPQNVLKLCNPDGTHRYAISDFGLMTPAAGQTTTLTATNAGGGTPLYCAPECTTNLRRATHLADIYSFGAILHDIFGGIRNRLPYDQLSVSGPLKDVVEKCTWRQPRRRFQSVEALREALFEALDGDVAAFASVEEEEIVNLLSQGDSLDHEAWDRVFDCIDENAHEERSNDSIFRALSIEHISALAEDSPELFDSLGRDYADYAQGTFGFDYCDVIASRAQAFYAHGDVGLRALVAVSILKLGTSHNRYYVERIFMHMASTNISNELAERIAVELGVQEVNFAQEFGNLEVSIGASKSSIHPTLSMLLEGQ